MKRPDPETHPSPRRAGGYLFTGVFSVTHCGNGNIKDVAFLFKVSHVSNMLCGLGVFLQLVI